MKRKLVQQGTSTLMISLPAKWVKENELSKGSEIELNAQEENLVISSSPFKLKSQTSIKLGNLTESSIRTLITNTYRKGYDQVKVNFDQNKQFQILNQIIKSRLMGFEVIKKEKNYCLVENITEPSEEQFEVLIRKIFYNVTELFKVTRNNFLEKKVDLEYEEIEERIQRYDNFCKRVISKRKISLKNSELLWTFLTLIIHGQREIYHLNKNINLINVSEDVKKMLDYTEKIFFLIQEAYFNGDVNPLSKVHQLEKDYLYKFGYGLITKNKKENLIIFHLMLAIREFYQANSPLSGLIL